MATDGPAKPEGGAAPPPPAPPSGSSARSHKTERRDLALEEVIRRNARGEYTSPREQFVFSQDVLSDAALAKIWDVSPERIKQQREKDSRRGYDWVRLRDQHWSRVLSRVSEVVEQQTTEDLQDSVSSWRAIIAFAGQRLQNKAIASILKKTLEREDLKEYLNLIKLMATTTKACVEVEEKMTGAKMAQRLFDQQMAEYDWFVETVKAYVREPQALEAIAKALQARRVSKTLVATEEYAEAIAYARQPETKPLLKAMDRLDSAFDVQAIETAEPPRGALDEDDEDDDEDDDPEDDYPIG